MDPIAIAAITGALTSLATEVTKGAASAAGKDAWNKIKELLGSTSGDALENAQSQIVERLIADPEIIKRLLELLNSSQSKNVGQLVGSIAAEKVVVANNIDNINM
jgi:uncharacterized protein YPO0396